MKTFLLHVLFALLLACVADVETAPPAADGGDDGGPCAEGSHNCEPDRPVALVCEHGYTPPGDCISRLSAHCCAEAP